MKSAHVVLTLALFAAVATAGAQPVTEPIDQIPMYGGMDRAADPSLRQADETLVTGTTRQYGDRPHASAAFVGNGFAFYKRGDLANAMRRFNQAWLLDPNNPAAYWGFGTVRLEQGKKCEAMHLLDWALSFDKPVEGMSADAALMKVQCAVSNTMFTSETREALLVASDEIYTHALANESDKGAVYVSIAMAFFWREDDAAAWAAVKLARQNGGKVPEAFLQRLRARMPEPK